MATEPYEDFSKYFRTLPADTPELKEQTYRLRYQVYCLETGFERPEDFPGGMEIDEYDERSEHYLIQHMTTGAYAATTRLILPDYDHLHRPFPIELHSQIEDMDTVRSVPRHRIGEASRFCVSKDFKRRAGEAGTLAGVPSLERREPISEEERRTFPMITLALIACLVRMSSEQSITHWYAVTEPAFSRFLIQLGIRLTPIGPVTNYHGMRQPCIIEVQNLLDGIKKKLPKSWNLVTDYGRYSKSSADRLYCLGNS